MNRYTQKGPDGYVVKDGEGAAKRLGEFEDFYQAVEKEYRDTEQKLEKLSEAGKSKSATYRQLFGNKLTLQSILSRLEVYISDGV